MLWRGLGVERETPKLPRAFARRSHQPLVCREAKREAVLANSIAVRR